LLTDHLLKAIKEIEKYERNMPLEMGPRIAAIMENMLELQKKLEASPHINIPPIARRILSEEMLRNQMGNLVETISKLVTLAKSLPEGDIRNQIYDRISELDSIADVQRKALDLLV
jgi:hypothetical protein